MYRNKLEPTAAHYNLVIRTLKAEVTHFVTLLYPHIVTHFVTHFNPHIVTSFCILQRICTNGTTFSLLFFVFFSNSIPVFRFLFFHFFFPLTFINFLFFFYFLLSFLFSLFSLLLFFLFCFFFSFIFSDVRDIRKRCSRW